MASTEEPIIVWEFPTYTYAFFKNKVVGVTDDHLKLFRYCATFGDFDREAKYSQTSFNIDRIPPPSPAQWRKFMAEFLVISAACNDQELPEGLYSNLEGYIKCRIGQIWRHYREHRSTTSYLYGMTRHFANRWSLSAAPAVLNEIKVMDREEFAQTLEADLVLNKVLSMIHPQCLTSGADRR